MHPPAPPLPTGLVLYLRMLLLLVDSMHVVVSVTIDCLCTQLDCDRVVFLNNFLFGQLCVVSVVKYPVLMGV